MAAGHVRYPMPSGRPEGTSRHCAHLVGLPIACGPPDCSAWPLTLAITQERDVAQAALDLVLHPGLARPMMSSDAAAMVRNVARDAAGMAQARTWLQQSWPALQGAFSGGYASFLGFEAVSQCSLS